MYCLGLFALPLGVNCRLHVFPMIVVFPGHLLHFLIEKYKYKLCSYPTKSQNHEAQPSRGTEKDKEEQTLEGLDTTPQLQ